ncbi:MAG: 4-hydroxyphenylpyruvate dioxygenase [Deltaproteobacteria bacterium]|nr:4-hydroxyphenylpyruvate dioxygenase [Deltaproteobacteria bacterium]
MSEITPLQEGGAWDNPAGLDGFAFIELADRAPEALTALLGALGFSRVGVSPSGQVSWFRQGASHVLLNCDPSSDAARFLAAHGPGVSAIALHSAHPAEALRHALARGAEAAPPDALDLRALRGVGGGKIYLAPVGWTPAAAGFSGGGAPAPEGVGLVEIDHLTHNVQRGGVDRWARFYAQTFNFREVRSFDIKGEYSGLFSRAMTAPDGRVRIPLNEEAEGSAGGQIDEFLKVFNGEGVQHVAFTTRDIYATIDRLRAAGVPLMTAPSPTYYEMLAERLPGHGEPLDALMSRGLLVDGSTACEPPRILLQIFTQTLIGPAFFEIIQRKGEGGFGEGNFKALFESMERDQLRRDALRAER